jgi:ABC-type phosphate/phosphonate transport system substrate-binding protein
MCSALIVLSLIVTACGGGPTVIQPTPLPTSTPTPRATLLPTVATTVPDGSSARPYQIVLIPPPNSTATGTSLAALLNDKTGLSFTVKMVDTYAEVLTELCGGTPTVAFVDGWSLATAMTQNCGVPFLKFQKPDGSSGVAADLIVSPALQLNSVNDITTGRAQVRDFCRWNNIDMVQSWILPVMLMRSVSGLNPLTDFRSIKDYKDSQSMFRDVISGQCIAALPRNTLNGYRINSNQIKVLASTAEIPYGGVMVSSVIPNEATNRIINVFSNKENAAIMKDYVSYNLAKANANDFAGLLRFFLNAGMNPPTVNLNPVAVQ